MKEREQILQYCVIEKELKGKNERKFRKFCKN